MKKNVKATSRGIISYIATCFDCRWTEADHTDTAWVRGEVYKHIRETGHRVGIEKAVSTHYELVGDE